MKLSDYAKHLGIAYQTAWKHYKKGLIPHPTRQLPSGAVIVEFEPKNQFYHKTFNRVAIYTPRVSSAENRKNLDFQAERLCQYSSAKGNRSIIWGKSFINKPQMAQNPSFSGSPPRLIERLPQKGIKFSMLLKKFAVD